MRRISTGIVGRELLGRFTAFENSLRSIENNQDIVLNPNGSGIIRSDAHIQVNDENSVRFADSGSSNYVEIKAPSSLGSNITLTLPDGTGSSGDVLTIDGSGNLSFQDVSFDVNNQTADTDTYYPLMSTSSSGEITGVTTTTGKLEFQPSSGKLTVTDGEFGDLTVTGDFSAGQLDVDGTLNVDSGTFFVDSANNRVGVGTSSPSTYLEVEASRPRIELDNTDTGGGAYRLVVGDSEDPDYISFFNANTNSEAARIDSSGNLLVGTTVSAAPLTVDGTISSPNIRVASGANNRNVINKQIESFDRENEKILLLIQGSGNNPYALSGTFIIGGAESSSSLNRVGCQTLFINGGSRFAALEEVVISGFESHDSSRSDGTFKEIDMKIVTLTYEGNTWLALYLPNRSTDRRRDTFTSILFNGVFPASLPDSLTWVTESDVSSISTVLDQSNNWVNTRNGASRIGN